MTVEREQSYLIIKDSTIFLYIIDCNDIFHYKNEIDENIANDKIIVLTIIWNGKSNNSNISQEQKLELYEWFNSLGIISIIVVDTFCNEDLLELVMMCDIRLGGDNLSIQFPENETEFIFNFEEHCQLLMGKKRNVEGYKHMLKTTKYINDLHSNRLINQVINMNDVLNEVQKYVDKIISNKTNYQIKAIIKCFNAYRQLGLNSNLELLLEEESKQFCKLILKEYINKEV